MWKLVNSSIIGVYWSFQAFESKLVSKGKENIKLFLLRADGHIKTEDFPEKLQTAFDPPSPSFWKIILHFFQFHVQKVLFNGLKS